MQREEKMCNPKPVSAYLVAHYETKTLKKNKLHKKNVTGSIQYVAYTYA